MTIKYTARIRPRFALDSEATLTINVNGLGKDERACKTDAQRQVRSYIKFLKYDLEVKPA